MLISGTQLIDMPVMSLQTGKELARTHAAIINPHNLTILAYLVTGNTLDYDPSYLRIADVREVGNIGMIIDNSDEFISTDDIVSDKHIYDMEYDLHNKQVVDRHEKKVGKVNDYIIDLDSFVIQQLSVRRPLLQSFKDNELLVNRSQIVEIMDDYVIIESAKNKNPTKEKRGRNYANLFQQSSPQPESIKIKD